MIKYVFWNLRGKPVIKYAGYNCGCCGKWVKRIFTIRDYESDGRWWDTWGLCPSGTGCNKMGRGK